MIEKTILKRVTKRIHENLTNLRDIQRIQRLVIIRQIFNIVSYMGDKEETIRQINSDIISDVAIDKKRVVILVEISANRLHLKGAMLLS